MDAPFSGHKLDPSIFPFPFSFPTFHQVDDILFGTIQNSMGPQITPGRKRAEGKDRHSKICTALGMRNRRMRLSLDVAPDFFSIQDMLGFDNASKTLRWLITMARPAIRDLVASTRGSSSSSSSSKSIESNNSASSACRPESPKGKRSSVCRRLPSRRAAFPATVVRELRVKARERARERTERKRLLQYSTSLDHLLYDATAVPFEEAIAKVEEEEYYRSPNQHRQLAAVFDYNQSTVFPNDTVNLFHQHWDMEDVQLIQSMLWED